MKYWHKYLNETEWQLEKITSYARKNILNNLDHQSHVKNCNFCVLFLICVLFCCLKFFYNFSSSTLRFHNVGGKWVNKRNSQRKEPMRKEILRPWSES